MDNGDLSSHIAQRHNRCGSLDLRQTGIRMTNWSITQKSVPHGCQSSTADYRICFSRLLRTRAIVDGIKSILNFPTLLGHLPEPTRCRSRAGYIKHVMENL